MPENRLVATALEAFARVGLKGPELLQEGYDSQVCGNATALFRLDRVLVRFLRDKGEDSVEIASTDAPDELFMFHDVAVEMGWISEADILAIYAGHRPPISLVDALNAVAKNLDSFQATMVGERGIATRARIKQVAESRGRAFVERLHEIANRHRRG